MNYQQSESITEIAKALNKVQANMPIVVKDKENPFFHSKYADLEGIWDAIRNLLAENGLSVVQLPVDGGLTTTLLHTSGEWISGTMTMHVIPDNKGNITPQAHGSAITYARRYALAAAIGVSPADDDGEAAMQRPASKKNNNPSKAASNFIDQINATGNTKDLKEWAEKQAQNIKKMNKADQAFIREIYKTKETELHEMQSNHEEN